MAGDGESTEAVAEDFFEAEAAAFDAAVAAAAEDDAGGVVEQAAEGQGGEHAVDAEGLFVDVFEKDDGAGGVGLVGGAHQGGHHGELAADEGAASNEEDLCTGMQDRAGPNTNLLSSVRRLW